MLFGGATLLSTRPALAKKKKQDAPTQATDEASPGDKPAKDEKPAEQAGDVEKPKTILDTSQDAPKTDSLGHVHFGSPNAEGLGRVAVKAAPESKIKIFLEGRYFGTAPLTIYSVPKGDYIVEAVYANGKQVSRPVTVGENEETAMDLGGAQALRAASGPGMFEAEMTPTRMTVTKVGLVVAAVGAVAALGCGIMVLKTESDYEKAVGQTREGRPGEDRQPLGAVHQPRPRPGRRRVDRRRHRRLSAGAASRARRRRRRSCSRRR